MREQQKEALEQVKIRVFGDKKEADNYMYELCMLVASTSGPLVISSMIEQCLKNFREIKKSKKKAITCKINT